MNKMKKLLSVFMAFTMIFSLISATAVFAENTDPDALPEGYVDNSNEGMLELQADYEMQSNAVQLMSAAPSELAGKKVEIAFLIDASGSMSPYIAKVKENVTAMAQYFESAGVNLRMAVVRYGASQDSNRANVLKINGSSWHTSTAQLVETLSNIPANGGTECLSDAIGDILKKNPITNNTDLQWSSDAYKFAFVLTNDFDTGVEGSYYNDYGYATLNSTIPDLLSKRIPVSVVTNTSYFSRYNSLATETGGELYDISSSDYLQLLIDYANKCMDVALKANKAIYVLPGYMGSRLYTSDGNEYWANVSKLSEDVKDYILWEEHSSKKDVLRLDENGENSKVHADISKDKYGSMDTYKNLIEELKKYNFNEEYDVVFFPYNWLADLNDSVTELESHIKKNGYGKVTFVTHSTGGLLASAYIAKDPDNKKKVEKAVLVAPPLYGTYSSLNPLETGKEELITSKVKDVLDGAWYGGIATTLGAYDYAYKWVRMGVHNSPTTYQLLPSVEYLKLMPQLYEDAFDNGKAITSMDEYYSILNGSNNINPKLTNGGKRSHKKFRESLGDMISLWDGNISSTLMEVDAICVGTSNGHLTPAIAKYKAKTFGGTEFVDFVYHKDGDGTVLGASAFALSNDATHKINWHDFKGKGDYGHTELIKNSKSIEYVCKYINGEEKGDKYDPVTVNLMSASVNEGMKNFVKINYAANKLIDVIVVDSNGAEVAKVTTADGVCGFEDNENFIFTPLSLKEDDNRAIVYIPKEGYKVKFFYGNETDIPVNFSYEISTLVKDGWKDITVSKTIDKTAENGILLEINGVSQSIENENIEQLIDGTVTNHYTEWELPQEITVNINDVKPITLSGSQATDVASLLNWSSSNNDIVTVSDEGVITAKDYGVATISATDGNKILSATVTVPQQATSVTLDDINLVIGERKLIKPVFVPANTTETDMTYTMSKPDIIEIDEFGVITALAAGSVTVTGKTSYGVEDSFVVVVEDDTNYAVASIEIVPSTISVANGKTTTFKVKFTPENATNKELNWLIEDNSLISIAPFGEDYTITGLKEGSTKVTAISVDGGYTSDAIVNVTSRSSGGSGNTAFNVTFETNGGSKISTKRVRKNTVLTAPANPTKEGYVFDGWYTNKELTKKYNFSNNVTKGFTLYAKWVTDEASTIVLTIGKKEAIVFGKTIENDVAPQVVNDRTMLPIRFIAEALGAEVIWNEEDPDKVTVKKDDIEIVINIGSADALVKGKKVTLDSPAFIENDRTYLPLRFVSENLGAKVEWKEDTEQVIITK